MELAIVLVILSIAAAVVVPALTSLGQYRQVTTTDAIITLLKTARQLAIQQSATVTVMLDPQTGHFRVDSVSAMGAGLVVEDSLRLGAMDQLETDQARLKYIFTPSGATFSDSVVIRGMDSTRTLFVDVWSGIPYAVAR
jgi:Tfp pilus assembly protein FimT